MDWIWSMLEIEPTRNPGEIKRAYARLTGNYHPEEDPEGFLRLRQAYQAALAWAEGADSPEDPEDGSWEMEEEEPESGGWRLREPETPEEGNPYRDHPAVRTFAELYGGKQRRDSRRWMEYVTSPAFLEVMRQPDFTAQLLAEVEKTEEPPSRELLTWLSAAYQYARQETQEGLQFQLAQGAAFEGIRSIFEIAARGPAPKRFAGDAMALFISFFEYNRLCTLAESGWSEAALEEAGQILGRYVTAYLQDKCVKREWNDVERHPASLRLVEQFFRRRDLPEMLYRMLWNKLNLKTALFGRAKVLYQPLRELVMERVPGIDNEEVLNFRELNKAHDAYRWKAEKLEQEGDPAGAAAETEAFFAREDFQRALGDQRFVEEQLLHYWLGIYHPSLSFQQRLLAYCQANSAMPMRSRVEAWLKQSFQDLETQRRNQEDAGAPVPEGIPPLANRPFFRYWLHVGFHTAKDPDSGMPLPVYLEQVLPFQPRWGEALLSRTFTTVVEGADIELRFHRRYLEYRVEGRPVYQQCLPWELLAEQSGDTFFYLLPMTAAFYSQRDTVYPELLRRLEGTAAPAEERAFLAGCLTDYLCRLPALEDPEGDPLAALPLELFAEDEERLFGASWYPREGVLLLFEQTAGGRRALPRGEYEGLFDEDAALSVARRLLDEVVSPVSFHLSRLRELPMRAYAQPLRGPEVFLEGEETEKGDVILPEEVLAEQLRRFAEGELRRLEIHWYSYDLVFVWDRAGYACFLFERLYSTWYTMLSQPEVYQTIDWKDTAYVPFGLGKLPAYCLFRDTGGIFRNLDLVFAQLEQGRPETRFGDRWLWASHTDLHDSKHRKLMAQQKLAGYPPERGRNYILAKFVFRQHPQALEVLTTEGERTRTEIRSGTYGQAGEALVHFMQSKLARLRLTWEADTPEARHLVLLQDGGRYQMVWLQDGKRRAEFYVADVPAYLKVEGKKYPKETFLGRTVPAYLVHGDLKRIRNGLDLLLDDMDNTAPVTNQFAEFASESPVKARPYEDIRAELIPE